jgi:hypothetical protein
MRRRGMLTAKQALSFAVPPYRKDTFEKTIYSYFNTDIHSLDLLEEAIDLADNSTSDGTSTSDIMSWTDS